ncbi:protein mcm10 homolog [Phtheirospermum japonicum]|uniref:Protein mcm10 homolog n=1 Tax=Phtheirospermum japonicum TaxID=374723 RepID=A0A830BSQ5_9LAMI|nr:protein mcm10 homolog [Phtheirospermum japonicum]
MSKSNHQDDLDLLLSLEERVLETPPASPSGYLSDDGMPKQTRRVDMSVFRDVVQDCLDYDPKNAEKSQRPEQGKNSNDVDVDKFSGLRIKGLLVSRVELSNHLSDIRFVRLPTIKTLLNGDTLSGCWATIGILSEVGIAKKSSIGQMFTRWKISSSGDCSVTIFLFGDAYKKTCEEKIGSVFALFNCNVRKDNKGDGFSLSVYNAKHILKLGTSPDFGVCQAKDKYGVSCKNVIDKRRRKYCDYHKGGTKSYTSTRAELKGGNFNVGFKNYLKSEGIYVVKPTDDRMNSTKSTRPMKKILSVEELKKALSKVDKVTTNVHSQGIRFLNHMTGEMDPQVTNKKANNLSHQQPMGRTDNRFRPSKEPVAKKMKMDQTKTSTQDSKKDGVKMIELDFVSSDDEL